jgi:hypothetical protein
MTSIKPHAYALAAQFLQDVQNLSFSYAVNGVPHIVDNLEIPIIMPDPQDLQYILLSACRVISRHEDPREVLFTSVDMLRNMLGD